MICILLAAGLSVDAFAAGLALGFDGIRVSAGAKAAVAAFSAAGTAAALWAGQLLGRLLPPGRAARAGAALLLAMGLWLVLGAWLRLARRGRESRPLVRLRVPGLGLTLCLLWDPAAGDADRSGSIDTAEGLPLALALSLDVLGAGLGVGAMGAAPWLLPPCVGLCQLAMLGAGLWAGRRFARPGGGALGGFCSGGVLVFIALLRLLA